MDTWALQVTAHAALTSGLSPDRLPLSGPASLDGFALGVMVAGLAFSAINSSWKLRTPWRPADTWQHTVRLARTSHQRARSAASRRAITAAAAAGDASPAAAPRPEFSRPYADATEPADLAHLVRVLPRADGAAATGDDAHPEQRKRAPSKVRKRLNVMIDQVLSDEPDDQPAGRLEPQADESFWGPGNTRPSAGGGGGYRSRHRLTEPDLRARDGEPPDPEERHELEQSRGHRRPAPRHAAS
jgi:uncharacterized membrane protein YccC